MKKLWNALARDLWVMILDLIAVNLSYFLALLIRFYVNFQLRPVAVNDYLPAFKQFAPVYTVFCLIIFCVFRLYGGIWRYAGLNDINRIILANLCAALVMIVGTALFVRRMPITYYAIGAVLQLALIVFIRFSYRFFVVERQRIASRKLPAINVLVVGAGENSRRVVKHLETSGGYRPVCVLDSRSFPATAASNASKGSGNDVGERMDGVPVIGVDQFHEAVAHYMVQSVFIADPLLTMDTRMRIKEACRQENIELQDYTGYFTNLGGRISLTELFAIVNGPLAVVVDGEERTFPSGEDALRSLTEKYTVTSLAGDGLVVKLDRKKSSTHDVLMREYMAEMGEDVFDQTREGEPNEGRAT